MARTSSPTQKCPTQLHRAKNPSSSRRSRSAVDQNIECTHAGQRVEYTSIAFAQIARYTTGMPGRKNLIWYTGAFSKSKKDKMGTSCYDSVEDMSSAGDLLEHSHVIVYPIDPRALDDLRQRGPRQPHGPRPRPTSTSPRKPSPDRPESKAIYNTNNLAAAGKPVPSIPASATTPSTTSPQIRTSDTRRRTINITVDQPNLTLVYKHAYDAVVPGAVTTGGGRPIP